MLLEDESFYHDELESIYRKYFKICEFDKLLYHYTDYTGLIGILTYKQIWLTDYKYLNDNSEVEYSYQEIIPIVLNNLNLLTNLNQDVMRDLKRLLTNPFYNHYNFYIFSMCARENYLPAWRWYSKDAIGFSIGFDFKDENLLPPSFQKNQFGIISSALIRYESESFNSYITELFNRANELLDRVGHAFARSALLCYVLPCLPLFKHRAYREEEEHRIFILEDLPARRRIPDEMKLWSPTHNDQARFVSSIPRVKIDINPSNIREIWVGPKCNFDHAKYEIDKMLDKFGFSGVEVKQSGIPYR